MNISLHHAQKKYTRLFTHAARAKMIDLD